MRKRRYAEGGEIESFGEDERPAPTDASEATKLVDKPAPAEPSTFGAAFKAARSAGSKTFTWKGKSYTTELASSAPTKKAASAPAKTAGDSSLLNTKAAPAEPVKRGFYENAQRAKDKPEEAAETIRETRRGAKNDKTTEETAAELRAKREAKNRQSNSYGLLGFAGGGKVRGMGVATRGAKTCKMR